MCPVLSFPPIRQYDTSASPTHFVSRCGESVLYFVPVLCLSQYFVYVFVPVLHPIQIYQASIVFCLSIVFVSVFCVCSSVARLHPIQICQASIVCVQYWMCSTQERYIFQASIKCIVCVLKQTCHLKASLSDRSIVCVPKEAGKP